MAGASITETIFNIPGIGQLAVQAIAEPGHLRDPDVTLVAALRDHVANLVVDIVYAFLDPRVRYE